MEYILSDKSGSCLFCEKVREEKDQDNLILFRGKHSFIIMNLYPYNNGHLMIVPYKHGASLLDLGDETQIEMMKLLKISEKIIRELMSPDGFNVGINIGEAAGAGIKEHIHIHIVPRWNGDTNFFSTIGDTKAIPEALKETYRKFHTLFSEIILN